MTLTHAQLPDAGRTNHFQIDELLPGPNEKAALEGSLGTPGASNRYLTEDDAPAAPAASRIVRLDTSGDLILPSNLLFTGSNKGLPFGSCWGNEIAWTQANAVQDTWYEISDADMADGQLNQVAHDGNGKLTVTNAGMYLANYTISLEASATNQHIQITFSISGAETNDGMTHFETFGTSKQQAAAGTAILDLAASATVEVSLRTTDGGTPDISVDHLNITLVQIGGT